MKDQRKVLNKAQIIDRIIFNLNNRKANDTRSYAITSKSIKV